MFYSISGVVQVTHFAWCHSFVATQLGVKNAAPPNDSQCRASPVAPSTTCGGADWCDCLPDCGWRPFGDPWPDMEADFPL